MDASRATHVFEVTNYSVHRDLGVESFVCSTTFHAGGCAWSLVFYPGGADTSTATYVAVGLDLMTTDAVVTASYDMSLVDETTGARFSAVEYGVAELDTRSVVGYTPEWCLYEFMKRSDLEASPFLRGDRLVIECGLRVITATREPPLQPVAEITVRPSSLPEDMSRLLEVGQGADVTFLVQGESFRAHRNILAVRAPLAFQAMIPSPQMGWGMAHVLINDMKPAVFKAMLHFVYADFLQGLDDLSKEDQVEMAQQLLAAAERFDMGRLKLVCEQILSKNLEVDTVDDTLVLSDHDECAWLKDACMISNRMDDVWPEPEGMPSLKQFTLTSWWRYWRKRVGWA